MQSDKEAPQWDAFLVHASEDKETIVRPLVQTLALFGADIWYDEFALKAGDSLSRSIDHGLINSKYGIVVLSPAFFTKEWPDRELRGLMARELGGEKVIIPIWHNVNHDAIMRYSPPLADKLAINTANGSIYYVALRTLEVIRPDLYARQPSAQDDMFAAIANDLGLSDLSREEQEAILVQFGEVALKAATVSVLERMPENEREQFAQLAEAGNAVDLKSFLDRVVPDHEAISKAAVAEEVRKFKEFQSSPDGNSDTDGQVAEHKWVEEPTDTRGPHKLKDVMSSPDGDYGAPGEPPPERRVGLVVMADRHRGPPVERWSLLFTKIDRNWALLSDRVPPDVEPDNAAKHLAKRVLGYDAITSNALCSSTKLRPEIERSTDAANFEMDVLRESLYEPVLVCFQKVASPDDRRYDNLLRQLIVSRRGQIKLVFLEIEDGVRQATAIGISSAPAIALFERGRYRASLSGIRPKREVAEFLSANGIGVPDGGAVAGRIHTTYYYIELPFIDAAKINLRSDSLVQWFSIKDIVNLEIQDSDLKPITMSVEFHLRKLGLA